MARQLCNLSIQYLESQDYHMLTGICPVQGCGLSVAHHRQDEFLPRPQLTRKDICPINYLITQF
jgi:hypothetical protein